MPQTKHVAGYYIKNDMDAIDLFIGSEGTLGIVAEIELKLCELPKKMTHLCIFLPKTNIVKLVKDIKASEKFSIAAIEYMDENSVKLLNAQSKGKKTSLGHITSKTESILYLEFFQDLLSTQNKESISCYDELESIFEKNNITDPQTWLAFSPSEIQAMKKFRHLLPEQINSIIQERKNKIPGLTKVATDMAVPDEFLEKILDLYKSTLDLEKLEYYIFGHIGNSHLHVNIIPASIEEFNRAKDIYKIFAREVVKSGGSVAAEHGLGKLKKDFLKIQYSKQEIFEMKEIKKVFDPHGLLNPGVIF